jgi:cytoskeletal protein CcmA (bactofilin family)
VEGTLVVAEKLEIRATARLRGALSARSIAVARGAVIEGEMAVTSGAPVVHYEEKRKTSG